MKNYKIAVAGTGYVGLSLGVLLSQHHQVVAVDIVQAKVDMINNKKSPIQDDYIEKYLAEKDLNLTATLDAKTAFSSYGCDLHIDNELVANAFAALPKQEQSILILFCVLELGDGEIGDLMGMSRSAVQRHRAKTLNELRKKLKAHLPEGG